MRVSNDWAVGCEGGAGQVQRRAGRLGAAGAAEDALAGPAAGGAPGAGQVQRREGFILLAGGCLGNN